ncbi:hypothetical protein CXG81DRAFT_24131 [Caulochytrium protostelioides]|uniref:ZZ-type domain-containing protein n=1 Tax=Caulochytrium protostelioides TaxID=1555241 RepID=A0A4P9XCS0_9FUNG|nr:hypothetical protein CXG81DRAFT_24131 [Caulochytrium protostelioides]|eukprot:RKP03246.1 hypothetical protein CXG81DRAFT_24131 [Caulochytrium protostelioides]
MAEAEADGLRADARPGRGPGPPARDLDVVSSPVDPVVAVAQTPPFMAAPSTHGDPPPPQPAAVPPSIPAPTPACHPSGSPHPTTRAPWPNPAELRASAAAAIAANDDYLLLVSALNVLSDQLRRSRAELEIISQTRDRALADPLLYVTQLLTGELPPLPKPHKIAACPRIAFAKYGAEWEAWADAHGTREGQLRNRPLAGDGRGGPPFPLLTAADLAAAAAAAAAEAPPPPPSASAAAKRLRLGHQEWIHPADAVFERYRPGAVWRRTVGLARSGSAGGGTSDGSPGRAASEEGGSPSRSGTPDAARTPPRGRPGTGGARSPPARASPSPSRPTSAAPSSAAPSRPATPLSVSAAVSTAATPGSSPSLPASPPAPRSAPPTTAPGTPWTAEEDEQLRRLIADAWGPDGETPRARCLRFAARLGTRRSWHQIASRVKRINAATAGHGGRGGGAAPAAASPASTSPLPPLPPPPSSGSAAGTPPSASASGTPPPTRKRASARPTPATAPVAAGAITNPKVSGGIYLRGDLHELARMAMDVNRALAAAVAAPAATASAAGTGPGAAAVAAAAATAAAAAGGTAGDGGARGYGAYTGPTVHEGYACDVCGAEPIVGPRWHCAVCAGDHAIDLCEECRSGHPDYTKLPHIATHPMVLMN